MKRVLCLFLTFALSIPMFSFSAVAAEARPMASPFIPVNAAANEVLRELPKLTDAASPADDELPDEPAVVLDPELDEGFDPEQITWLAVNGARSLIFLEGDSKGVTVIAKYEDGTQWNVSKLCSFESSDEAVATVDENGIVTAVGFGEAEIEAKIMVSSAGNIEHWAAAVVRVYVDQIDEIEFFLEWLDLGEIYEPEVFGVSGGSFMAVITDDCEIALEDADNGCIIINEDGHLEAIAYGSATVIITYGELELRQEIVVRELEGLRAEFIWEPFDIGDQIAARILGSYTTPFSKDLTSECEFSSSDTDIVSVDENGVMTAVNYGAATITATYGDFSVSFNIEVMSVFLHDMSMDEQISLAVGQKWYPDISGTYWSESSGAYGRYMSDQITTCSSSDPEIVDVSIDPVDGYLTLEGISPGVAMITVECEDISLTFAVACDIDITSLSISGQEDIDFDRNNQYYTFGETTIAIEDITYEAFPGTVVDIVDGDSRFEKLLIVSDSESLFEKVYHIRFYDRLDSSDTEYPYIMQSDVTTIQTDRGPRDFVNLWVIKNKFYEGVMPDEDIIIVNQNIATDRIANGLWWWDLRYFQNRYDYDSDNQAFLSMELQPGETMYTVANPSQEDSVATPLAEALFFNWHWDDGGAAEAAFELTPVSAVGFDLPVIHMKEAAAE